MKFTAFATTLALATTSILHAGTEMADPKAITTKTSTSASDAGVYVAIYGGAQFATNYGNSRETVTSPGGSANTHSAFNGFWGGAGGIRGGYKFDSYEVCTGLRLQPAVEADLLYLGTQAGNNADVAGTPLKQRTSFNSGAGFVNGILRFKNDSIVTPYIGLGVGGQHISMHSHATVGNLQLTGLTGNDTVFAAQAIGGLDVALTKNWAVFGEYKFVDAIGTDITVKNVNNTGADLNFTPDQIQQHLVVAGVKYNF